MGVTKDVGSTGHARLLPHNVGHAQREAELQVGDGQPHPLGVSWDGAGVNVAVWSAHATAIEFCAFDRPGDKEESSRILLPKKSGDVWHGHVTGVHPRQPYGFRVHGPFDPRAGHRFNPQKLLIDPYAKAICGDLKWHVGLCDGGDRSSQPKADPRDTAGLVPKSVVIDSSFNWEGDVSPRVPWEDTVIYECHVKGLTVRHPDVPLEQRGRYLGLASEPVIDHLKKLGVTAVELLPVQHSVDERALVRRGLVNYWGYNPLAFFAPHGRYATGDAGEQVAEFRQMVILLHRAGVEILLDVVFNHTGEGDDAGPTLCLKGVDNATFYRLRREDRQLYQDMTGCGNTVNFGHPAARRLVMDCLRYWVEEMHVDGFRFDLATVLAREEDGTPVFNGLLQHIAEDPILSGVKLIAEPWDVGPDGYQLGRYPQGWSEWNDRYGRTVRRFWRGDDQPLGRLAYRLAGSDDLFRSTGRGACAGINYVTSHDGFTLHDLVSYERKRNQANGQRNRDGSHDNASCNWGFEGTTKDAVVLATRRQMQRNFLLTMMLSRGVPMLLAGDEMGRTQQGNNNAYCQDNELSWLDWELDVEQERLLTFTRATTALRRRFKILRSCQFYEGRHICDCGLRDITWMRPDGLEMTLRDWEDPAGRTLGMLVHDHDGEAPDRPTESVTLLVIFHSAADPTEFILPRLETPGEWRCRFDTADSTGKRGRMLSGSVTVQARSLVLCEHVG